MTDSWFAAPDRTPTAQDWNRAVREELLDEPPTVEIAIDVVPGRTVLHIHHHAEHIALPDLLTVALGVLALLAWASLIGSSWLAAPMPARWAIYGVLLAAAAGSIAALVWSWRARREER